MAYQTGKNVLVAYKPEVSFNTPVSGGSGYQFRPNASSGLTLAQAVINPNEIRPDGKMSMGRYGSKSVTGSYSADLSVTTFDPLIEAVMRGTWVAAVAITQATMTSITTGTNTIVAAAGSWITQGVRVGDVVRLTLHSTAANNNRNLRVTGVTASTITVAETLTPDAVADTTFAVTIQRKLTQPAVPVRRSFTFEEYEQDLDLSEVSTGCRVSSMRITGAPDAMCIIEFGIVGADLTGFVNATSPTFTSPTLTSTIALTMVDATLRFGGADVASLTAFEVSLDMGARGQPVIGSRITPDIFESNTGVTGSLSGLRTDFTNLTRATAETELEFNALLVQPESEPKGFVNIFIPRIKIQVPSKGFGQDGAMIETMPFIVGTKGTATGYDDSMLTVSSS